jgi:ankyrin repeat protein
MPDIAALKVSVAAGDLAACQSMLTAAPALAHDPRALLEASLFVDFRVMRLLLEAGADPDGASRSESRLRPLHRVIEIKKSVRIRGDRGEAVELLLDAGANVDAPGCWYAGRPLETAARGAQGEIAAILWRRGARKDVYAAVLARDADLLDQVLKADRSFATAPSSSGAGALHLLCASRLRPGEALAMAEALVAAGTDADASSIAPMVHGSFAAMHFASWGGGADPELLRFLAAHGADPGDGLYETLWFADFPAAATLLELGASPDAWSHVGKRPLLHDMIQWGRTSAATWLLEAGANPNQRDSGGRTALHYAASRGQKPAFVERLLAAGADPEARDAAGEPWTGSRRR